MVVFLPNAASKSLCHAMPWLPSYKLARHELAVDAHLVVLPCEGLVQFGEVRVGLRGIDDAAVVINLTIVWQ